MKSLYMPMLVTHVLVAVLGVGSIASVAVVAGRARRDAPVAMAAFGWLGPLLRYSAVSLGVMFLTGALLDLAARGAFSSQWWFRGSAILLFVTGALHGAARRTLRQGLANGHDGLAALRRVERIAYAMCALVAVITVLMETRPF